MPDETPALTTLRTAYSNGVVGYLSRFSGIPNTFTFDPATWATAYSPTTTTIHDPSPRRRHARSYSWLRIRRMLVEWIERGSVDGVYQGGFNYAFPEFEYDADEDISSDYFDRITDGIIDAVRALHPRRRLSRIVTELRRVVYDDGNAGSYYDELEPGPISLVPLAPERPSPKIACGYCGVTSGSPRHDLYRCTCDWTRQFWPKLVYVT